MASTNILKKPIVINDFITFNFIFYKISKRERDREGTMDFLFHWSPKCQLSFLIRWLNNFGDFNSILIGLFIKLSVQTFQPLILIYR